jgi:hypothetical protein
MKRNIIEEVSHRTGIKEDIVRLIIRHFFATVKEFSKRRYPISVRQGFKLLINKRLYKKLNQYKYVQEHKK